MFPLKVDVTLLQELRSLSSPFNLSAAQGRHQAARLLQIVQNKVPRNLFVSCLQRHNQRTIKALCTPDSIVV